jgi:hypothetical protein
VIVSLLYQLTRRLLSAPVVLLRGDTAKDAELLVLRHENAVLRRQIPGKVRYEPADRFCSPPCPRCSPDAAGTRSSLSNLRRSWQPQIHRREVGLQCPPMPQRTAAHPRDDQEARLPVGPRKPTLGAQENPRRTGRTRTPDRRIDRVEDPELSQHRSRLLTTGSATPHRTPATPQPAPAHQARQQRPPEPHR